MKITVASLKNSNANIPCEMPAVLMDIHFVGFVLVELLPDGGLVLRGQARPRSTA